MALFALVSWLAVYLMKVIAVIIRRWLHSGFMLLALNRMTLMLKKLALVVLIGWR
jgi:hypothetical protein